MYPFCVYNFLAFDGTPIRTNFSQHLLKIALFLQLYTLLLLKLNLASYQILKTSSEAVLGAYLKESTVHLCLYVTPEFSIFYWSKKASQFRGIKLNLETYLFFFFKFWFDFWWVLTILGKHFIAWTVGILKKTASECKVEVRPIIG